MRDTTKILTLNRSGPIPSKSQVQVYSPAGESLLLFSVDYLCNIISTEKNTD